MRNFPPEVMPNLFDSLGEDIKWALENSDTKDAFKYENMLVVAPCFYEQVETRKKGKKQKMNKEQGNCLFFHFEDEVMQKVCNRNTQSHSNIIHFLLLLLLII